MQDVKRKQAATISRGYARHVELSEREQAWANEFAAEGVCLVGSRRSSSSMPVYLANDATKG